MTANACSESGVQADLLVPVAAFSAAADSTVGAGYLHYCLNARRAAESEMASRKSPMVMRTDFVACMRLEATLYSAAEMVVVGSSLDNFGCPAELG